MYVYGRVRMAGFSSVLHEYYGHGTRNQAICPNVRLSATDHSPAAVYIDIYGHVWQHSHTPVSHNVGVAVQVCHMQHMYQCDNW